MWCCKHTVWAMLWWDSFMVSFIHHTDCLPCARNLKSTRRHRARRTRPAPRALTSPVLCVPQRSCWSKGEPPFLKVWKHPILRKKWVHLCLWKGMPLLQLSRKLHKKYPPFPLSALNICAFSSPLRIIFFLFFFLCSFNTFPSTSHPLPAPVSQVHDYLRLPSVVRWYTDNTGG